MEGEESFLDEEKLKFINEAGQEYAAVNCNARDGEEREKCFQVRGSLRDFAMHMVDLRKQLQKCQDLSSEGPYTSPGTVGLVSCMSELENTVKGLVEEHYEKLNGLGYTPSS